MSFATFSLRNVLDALSALPIPNARRDELRRDVQRIAAHLRRDGDLSAISVTGPGFKRRLESITSVALDCSPKRRDNILSNVRRACELTIPSLWALKGTPEVENAWDAIVALCGTKKKPAIVGDGDHTINTFWLRVRTNPLLRYLRVSDIAPHRVQPDCYEAFRTWRQATSWDKNEQAASRSAVIAWNTLVDHLPAWPQVKIELPSRQQFTLPLHAFADEFQADVANYLDYCHHPEMWPDARQQRSRNDQTARPYDEDTIKSQITTIRLFGSHLVANGVPTAEIRGIIDLVRYGRFQQVMDAIARAEIAKLKAIEESGELHEWGAERTSSALTMARAMRTVICNWCHPGPESRKTMNEIVNQARVLTYQDDNGARIERRVRDIGLTSKNRRRLEAIGEKGIVTLRLLPGEIMDEVEAQRTALGSVSSRMATRFQTALMMAIVWRTPIRLENLQRIDLQANYVPPSGTKQIGKFELIGIKNKKPITITLDERFLDRLDLYLKHYLPVLRAFHGNPATTRLFPGQSKGGYLSKGRIYERITNEVETGLPGSRWNVHLFRHLVGLLLVRKNPANLPLVAIALGNSVETCRRFYLGDQSHKTAEIVDTAMIDLIAEIASPEVAEQIRASV